MASDLSLLWFICILNSYARFTVMQTATTGKPVSSNLFASLEDEAKGVADSKRWQQHASAKQQQDQVQGKKHEEQQQQQKVGLGMFLHLFCA